MPFLGSSPPITTTLVALVFISTFLANRFSYCFSSHYNFRRLETLKDSMKSLRANIMERLDQQGRSIREIKEMIIQLSCKINKFATGIKKNVEVPKTVSVCLCANKLEWPILIVN